MEVPLDVGYVLAAPSSYIILILQPI